MREEFIIDHAVTDRWDRLHEKLNAEKQRVQDLVKDYIASMPEENEYLRRKGAELLEKIRGADSGGNRQGTTTSGVAGEQTDSDDFKWHPGFDMS